MKRAMLLLALFSCDGCGQQRSRETIAVCTDARGEVRTHPQEELVWNAVKVGDGLAWGDWVRTGVDSRAQIRFQGSGAELGIDPSSTIVIQQPDAAPNDEGPFSSRIMVEKGVVRVASASARTEVELATPGGETIRVTPAEAGRSFRYRVTVHPEGTVELAVTEGRAEVSGADGTTVALEEGQAHDLVAGSLVGKTIELPPFPELIAPGVDANVVDREELSIDLVWSEVPAAAAYRLEVSTDQSFVETIVDEAIEGTRGAFSPAGPGSYHWRVASRTSDGRESEFGFARRIHVTKTPQNLLIAPADDQLIKVIKQRPLVEFSWRAVLPPAEYRLVVARSPELRSRIAFEKRTDGQKVSTRELDVGTYWWGVFAAGDEERALFTKPRRLRIKRDAALRTPDKVTF